MSEDLYGALGLGKDATPEEVKEAYRRRARDTHPDKAGGSTEAFQAVTRAYVVLRDSGRRADYDAGGPGAAALDPYAEALKTVAMLVLRFLNECDSDRVDMVKFLTVKMTEERGRLLQQQANVVNAVAKRERALKRVTKKGGENLIAGFIVNDIEAHGRALEELERQLQLNEDVAMVLKDYEYLTDSAPPAPSPMVSTYKL